MRLSLRFIVPLALALGLVAWLLVPLADKLTVRWFVRDLDMRAALVANTLSEPVRDLAAGGSKAKMLRYFNKITQDERLFAVGYCESADASVIATGTFPALITCKSMGAYRDSAAHVLNSPRGLLHVSVTDLDPEEAARGSLVLVHDMSFVQRRSSETKTYLFYLFAGLGALVSIITVVIAQLSWRGWVQGLRALMRGEGLVRPLQRFNVPELQPIARDLRTLMLELENEYRPLDDSQLAWTPETLRAILRADLRGEDILVVSNREPYIHERSGDGITVRRPASGLVTALEPIMRACSGTWIAHGSGSADRSVVDGRDRVAVPPEHPSYGIRRVWLSAEEEAGYYFGFANEGMWPLCHNAHVRPVFRGSDWQHYIAVNRKFARAVVEESRTGNPIVLVQDYHFALLPRMIRERLPNATIITFWHIPWPNPETFSICPWREALLDGLLGSSILGFHTRFHCNNFVDTVDRELEARVDRETFTISYGNKLTAVKRYPISIEWPPEPELLSKPVEDCRAEVRRRHQLRDDQLIGIGVDRLDYTKGIIERFRAVERLLEIQPEWIGRFIYFQIAAPSRSSIEPYRVFAEHVRATAARINERFGRGDYQPILLKEEHHEPAQVYEYYRAAELCFVGSLHDGMNLVAKEFLAARDDGRGVLILSQFTGAARELPEALVVNPYDIDQCAAALHLALSMPQSEQRERMRLMRGLIREFNVYRWAGRMLLDAASMRKRGHLLENPQAQPIPLRAAG